MTRVALVAWATFALACAPTPKLTGFYEPGLQRAQATGRHMDDMSFNVPGQSLMRCTRVTTRLRADSDPSPDLDGPIDPTYFGRSCSATLHGTPDDERRTLDVVGIHVDLAADGRVTRARILERVGDADPNLESCLLANARSFHWPANRTGKPYEKQIFNVFALSALGETTWRMMDTIRRMSEPRRAICACLRDAAPDLAMELDVSFKLPASRAADVTLQNLSVPTRDPFGLCLAGLLQTERFTSSGLDVDVAYVYHIDPSDAAVDQAVAEGQASLPTEADDPIIAIRVGRSASVPPPNP